MKQREKYADDDGKNKAESHIIVYKFGYQRSAEQCTEQSEAHGNRQRKFLKPSPDSADPICSETSDKNHAVREKSECNCAVDIR